MTLKTGIRLSYAACDYLMVAAGWLVFNIVRYYTGTITDDLPTFLWHYPQVLAGQALIPPMMVLCYLISGFYNEVLFKSRLDDINNTLVVSAAGTLIIYFVVLVNDNIPERMRVYETLLVLMGLLSAPTMAARLLITYIRRRHGRRRGGFIRAVVVGGGAEARRVGRELQRSGDAGVFDVKASIGPEEAGRLTAGGDIDAVIVADQGAGSADLLATLYRTGLQIYITPGLYSLITSRPRMSKVVGEPLINITNANLPPSTQNFKRAGDIICSAVALVALLPVYAAVALAVRLDSPGPVFYRQERVGYHRRRFRIIKFRTMHTDAEPDGPALSAPADPRVTRVGRFLRKYRLDELPQFWNVLRGQMSLVGPRPEREYYAERIREHVPYYSLIHQVRPGITSWGMVKYGYASTVDEMIERLRYDLLYVENVSLGLDIKILFHTVSTVLTGRGV